jgi:hypothetical protein
MDCPDLCLKALWLQEWEWVLEDCHKRSCWKNSIRMSVPRPYRSDVYVCSKSFRLCLTVVYWLLECNKVPSWIENPEYVTIYIYDIINNCKRGVGLLEIFQSEKRFRRRKSFKSTALGHRGGQQGRPLSLKNTKKKVSVRQPITWRQADSTYHRQWTMSNILFVQCSVFQNFRNRGLHRHWAPTRTAFVIFSTLKTPCKWTGETLFRWLNLPQPHTFHTLI